MKRLGSVDLSSRYFFSDADSSQVRRSILTPGLISNKWKSSLREKEN
jgi:hypothetical protein